MFYITLLLTFAMHFFTCRGVHLGDQSVINNVAGFMVEQLTDKYPHSIGIGNLTSSHLFGTANFAAYSGMLSDIHSIEPSGDVIVLSDNDEMNVTLTFTFKLLKVVYPEVTIGLMGVSTCGSLEGTADDNLFSVFARISEDSHCFVALHDFDVIRLSNFNVNYTPSPESYCPIVGGVNKITNMAMNYFQEIIKKKVEEGIHKAIRKHIVPSKFICVKF